MAREEKKIELRPVDDLVDRPAPVVRLESHETLERGKAVRLDVPVEEAQANVRLEVPDQPDLEIRTHQPGIEALIDSSAVNVETVEHIWGQAATEQRSIPWGWFFLIGISLVGGAVWSITQLQEAEPQAAKIVESTKSVLDAEAREELEASELIDRIESTSRKFFAANTKEILASYSRDSGRVGPLMDQFYSEKPLVPHPDIRTNFLKPLTLDNRTNFWMQSVRLDPGTSCNVIIEIEESGEPKIDWETMVCYQPMNWDAFAVTRPEGRSLDFRVYVEPDDFFSHEFGDPTLWTSFRLTALNSDETLFGYAKMGDPVSSELITLFNQSANAKLSLILRLSIPEGIRSRRGVVIEKVMSPRWIYLDPPSSDP